MGMEQKILSDICKGNWNGDQEKPIAKAARELQCSANGTVHSSEWSNIDGLLWFRGKIYVPQSSDLYRQIIALCLRTKPWRYSPVGELQPLSVPDTRWNTLRSDAHNGHSGRSSQTLSSPCLEALWPPEVCCLRLQTPVRSFVH